jgi:hypothetical protein
MKTRRMVIVPVVLAVVTALSGRALSGQVAPIATITVDENGHGNITSIGGSFNTTGTLAADPGPGGLSAALTYNLLGPPSLVAGDLLLDESPGVLSDIIRFNSTGSGNGTLVFYSDTSDGADSLADTGFPTSQYTNTVTLTEVGPEGANGITYIPTANQPGFIAGFITTYNITSDSVPEPATLTLLAGSSLMVLCRRGRRRTA